MILDLIGLWYLLSDRRGKVDQRELMNMIQASYEQAETKDEFVQNL
jgi:hypothetical protein